MDSMDLIQFYEEQIFPSLPYEEILSAHNLEPEDKISHFLINCFFCGAHEAFIYKNSDWIECNRKKECGKKINIFSLMNGGTQPYGLQFVEILKKLCTMTGKSFPEGQYSPPEREFFDKRFYQQQFLNIFKAITIEALHSDNSSAKKALKYLEGRGFPLEKIRRMDFGFYPDKEFIKKKLLEKHQLPDLIFDSGIYRGDWNGRIIFPIKEHGIIGDFIARYLTQTNPDEKKYLRMNGERAPDNSMLMGLDNSGRDILIVEGLFDYLVLTDTGIKNVVNLGGSNLSGNYLKKFKKHRIKQVTLLLDPDHAGTEGISKFIQKLLDIDIEVYVVPTDLLNGLDPDEYVIKHGVDGFNKLLDAKILGHRWMAQYICNKNKKEENSLWKDAELMAALHEAERFEKKNKPRTQEMDIFWGEFTELTGIMPDVADQCRQSIQAKKASDAKKRLLEDIPRRITQALASGDVDIAEAEVLKLHDALKEQNYNQETHFKKEIKTLDKLIDAQEERLAQYKGKEFIGIPQKTIPKLDELLLGLRKFIMLAAAPNVGKTAFSIQISIDLVRNNPDTCLVYVSLEMSREEIEDRIKCSLAGITYKKLYFGSQKNGEKGWYTKEEMDRLNTAKAIINEIGNKILILDEETLPAGIDAEIILSHTNDLKKETGSQHAIAVIDYLGVFPIPEESSQKILSENDADRYRTNEMKKLRKGLNNDPLIVIAEARKQPTGSEIWTVNSIADILGSSRNGYSIDAAILLNNLTDEELENGISNPDGIKKSNKAKKSSPNDQKEEDKLDGADIRNALSDTGITIIKLRIDKARDGMQKGEFLLAYHFLENRFEQITWPQIAEMVPIYVQPARVARDEYGGGHVYNQSQGNFPKVPRVNK